VIGIGLAVAPVAFRMFDRAPQGGRMIDDFAPYMTHDEIDRFRGDLASIGAAHAETHGLLGSAADADRRRWSSVTAFDAAWPAIDEDMRSMLSTMEDNIGHYRGVAALPPFWAFPWFFVIPGVLIAGVAGWTLVADRHRPPARGRRVALALLAVGLIAAPAVFQMFTRAPGGARMIDDFKPFMTREKVTQVQGYFLVIGAAEGQLRLDVMPALAASTASTAPATVDLAAIAALSRDWPGIAAGMAPMIGTMADNVDNFAAVVALPPFWLFPWFFVIPGVLIVALVVVAGRHRRPTATATVAATVDSSTSRPAEGALEGA
ncbi:MAG: hypothetical protein ACRD0U_02835, partial [Acidimicrobiales bacterium]